MVWQVIAQWSLIFQYLKPQNYAFIHQWIYRAKLPEILNWSIKLIYLQVKSPGIKNHQSFCSFLVHYSVPTFSASDWISCFYFIFCMTFWCDGERERQWLHKNSTAKAQITFRSNNSQIPFTAKYSIIENNCSVF